MKLPEDNGMSTASPARFEGGFERSLCEKLAGPFFHEMLQGYQATRAHLTHADPRARIGALFMLREYWKPAPDFAELCEKLAFADEDVQVRSGALSSVCGFYYNTHDVRMGRLFARLVRDDSQPLLHRRVAYLALYALRGLSQRPHAESLQFPDEVDWEFVDSFFEDTNKAVEKRHV